ncbi:hypothetical protein EV175_003405 [Coemansia sp. RSA 1933]|nr:hypothetical protein EV175_003405 [Coemansia sp. RSA 1933]
MMYTSMDYLTPGNFQRGNGYMLDMYNGLPRRLRRLHKRLMLDYQEEHEQLVASFVHPMQSSSATRTDPSKQQMKERRHNSNSNSNYGKAGSSRNNASRIIGRPNSAGSAFQPVDTDNNDSNNASVVWRARGVHDPRSRSDHTKPMMTQDPKDKSLGSFDPKHYLGSLERAEKVLEDLEALSLFVEFIIKFIDVRKTMVVLYRFVAVTSPVLYVPKLDVMLKRCKRLIESIQPSPHYQMLLDNVRSEVWLVRNVVDWDSQIAAYNFVKAITTMQNTRGLLNTWQESFPEGTRTSAEAVEEARAHSKAVADALGHNANDSGINDGFGDSFAIQPHNAGARGSSQGLLYMAFAKSSQLVQNLFWRGSSGGSADAAQESGHACIRGVVKLLDCWVSFLSFKTTAYFQQIIASHRSLYYDDMATQAKRAAVMNDIWSRPELSKTDLGETLHAFMTENDACFVTLLFESSKKHPFSADGFALRGTKLCVSDYRVQACAVLFCIANERLMASRGHALKESIIHDVHSTRPGRAWTAAPGSVTLQPDVEWLRQNCLPDILSILDSDHEALDYELLGSSPLVDKLGANADELLVELGELVHGVIEETVDPVNSAQESAGDTLSSLEHGQDDAAYQSDDAASTKPSDHPNQAAYSAQHPRHEDHQSQQPEEAHHHAAYTDTVDKGHHAAGFKGDHQDNPNLYSTYLLKSHLRNNLQHDEQAYSSRGNRRFAGRHSGQAMRNRQGQQLRNTDNAKGRPGPQSSRDSGIYDGQVHAQPGLRTAGQTEPKASTKAAQMSSRDTQKPGSGMQRLGGSAANLTLPHAAAATTISSGGSVKRRVASTSRVSGIDSGILDQGSGRSRSRVSSIQNADTQTQQQAMRRNANTISTPSPVRKRTAQSIRSLFNPSLLLGMASHQSSSQEQLAAEESAVEKRVRRGMRLRELFGSWDTRSSDDASEGISLRRFNQLLPQPISRVTHAKQQQQQPHPPPPPLHSGHSSSDAVAGVASETYTYLYARVGLPNVVIVAALLDTERGLARRNDTRREWDAIVDKLRGMTLFEQMMTVAG